uniref:Uncharacterized protein n=1 Tax=Poecilia reticulata TaxID=8081 RepID=A0A3P9PWI9_POERE
MLAASLQGVLFSLTYQNLLVLGAIAAASAFVVTILIVLVCVGCQRKHRPRETKIKRFDLHKKAKSDTRLHEINRFPCNGNCKC